MGSDISSSRKLKNSLPQGSVLAPLLCSLYIADMPETRSRKFVSADDWVLATRCSAVEQSEETLTTDPEGTFANGGSNLMPPKQKLPAFTRIINSPEENLAYN